ncbi:TPA_exp: Uncharacterized protein A8136_1509 [Trichophyton benhamiae CBS 112371]|nr:TPA_exp: Uncharacterized protein A8136_1509 [Trichophyton benhamiae CBS 112371]
MDAKLLKTTKFPPEFAKKVDMTKVNIEVMKKWIAERISDILGNEDDVVIELCFNLLEGSRFPNIKHLQINLTGFLEKDTAKFCKDLWNLCLSAQDSPQGVPKELLEAKKLELMQEQAAAEEARRRAEAEQARERDLERIRRREREDRGRGRRGRGGPARGADRSRKNSSAPSPPAQKRQRIADSDGETARSSPQPAQDKAAKDNDTPDRPPATDERPSQRPASRLTSTELRERLLKEKVIAMRRMSAEKAATKAS